MEIKNDIDIKDEDLKEDDFTPEELDAEDVDWKAKAQELKGIAKRRATQLGKVKAKFGELEIQIADLKKPKEESKPQDKIENKSQSNEPDYAKLAFLETKGITHPDDQKTVQDEAERLKLPLTDILGMEHIKSKLALVKDQRESQAGMPKGTGRGKGTTQDNVDYWIDKKKSDGTFDTPDDLDLAAKVIEARIKKEEKANMFSDELYTG